MNTRGTTLALGLTLMGLTLTATREAEAFCGFYVAGSTEQLVNKATRVALMRDGTRTVLSMSNDYQGPPQNFAMVVPVPIVLQQTMVKVLPHDVFSHIEQLTAPRLVEYWEQDPCLQQNTFPSPGRLDASSASFDAGAPSASADAGVRIEAQFVVGEYEIVVLSADESTGLETWLRTNGYNIPQGSAVALDPYVREQWKFFVAKVNVSQVTRRADGSAVLSPLRFHYDSPDFRLPVRLGLLNAPEKQDLIVYVLSPDQRYEVSNYPNVFVPTNLDVINDVRTQFGTFYAALFDRTIQNAGGKAVVTEYAWQSSSCDPCPTPPLSAAELMTLGGDVVAHPPQQYGGMVVSRLHTRYDRATLTDDLMFRAATPVAGGREFLASGTGGVEQGTRSSQYNNFQARYAIRHEWTGAITCANPRRGVWGGNTSATAATGLESVPRTMTNPETSIIPGIPGTVRGSAVGPDGVPIVSRAGTCACTTTPGQTVPWSMGGVVAAALAGSCLVGARRRRPIA